MRSYANIKSHPLHTMLIVFPIAFLLGTLVFDILGIVYSNDVYFAVSYYMQASGIIGGVLAAVPGMLDYFKTVPPNSSAKRRGMKHALLNIAVLILFSIAWLMKDGYDNPYVILTMECVGLVLMFISAWLGGTLVYRNQIGVDPRYANAGRWKEEHKHAADGLIEAAGYDELQVNQMKLVHVHDKRIVLSRTEDGYRAFDDRCPHKGGSLAGGAMICGTVQCPWHGSQFNVDNGSVQAGPAKEDIKTYKVAERNGKIFILL